MKVLTKTDAKSLDFVGLTPLLNVLGWFGRRNPKTRAQRDAEMCHEIPGWSGYSDPSCETEKSL